MIRAVLLSPSSPPPGPGRLFRQGDRRSELDGCASDGSRAGVVVVDSALPARPGGFSHPAGSTTRSTAIVALGRSEFGFGH